MRRGLDLLANAFPLWVLAACGLALIEPALFTWFRGAAIVAALALIMLGMGVTLSVDDFTWPPDSSRSSRSCPWRAGSWRRRSASPRRWRPA
jgi:hypothetical protein